MLCVLARIDDQSRQKLYLLQKEAEKQGIPLRHLHGHITLAVYTGADEGYFIEACKTILKRFSPFTVRYQRLTILREPSIISVCPFREGTLDEMQRQIVIEWTHELHQWSQRDIWLPHTTLVQDAKADLETALQAMQDIFVPFDANISCVEFSAVRPEGYEIIDRFLL